MTAPLQESAAPTDVRLDKWLWCVRAYKTRALATEACRHGKVTIDGEAVRPSREVRPGLVVGINFGGWVRTLRVVAVLGNRVGAGLVARFAEDLTPPEELAKARERSVQNLLGRPHGEGRPTKRERRAIDRAFRGPYDY